MAHAHLFQELDSIGLVSLKQYLDTIRKLSSSKKKPQKTIFRLFTFQQIKLLRLTGTNS